MTTGSYTISRYLQTTCGKAILGIFLLASTGDISKKHKYIFLLIILE